MGITPHMTADELFQMGEDAPYLLIEGELVEEVSPQGRLQGKILLKLSSILDNEIVEPDVGELLVGDVGFVLARNPDTVLAPDLAFVRADRLTNAGDAYLDLSPDLAIEVVTPSNSLAAIARKMEFYLRYGSNEIWVVRPRQRDIVIHRIGASPMTVRDDESLTSPLFPGKTFAVSRIFPPR